MILTVTFNPAIDLTYKVDEELSEKNVLRTSNMEFDAGGKGINVSSYLESLDIETAATGLLGGFTGKFIRKELDEQGLNYDFVESGITRVNTTVIGGKTEYKINHSGPETGKESVEKIIEKVRERSPEKVVVSGSLPPGLESLAIERIREEVDAEVIADLHGDILGELEGGYLLAKPNRKELSEASGIEVDSIQSAKEACKLLLDQGFETILASLGEKGALLVDNDRAVHAEGLNADVEDTTGAGDALLSAYLSGLEEDLSHRGSLKKALGFATLVVETPGTGIPELSKLEEYKERVELKDV